MNEKYSLTIKRNEGNRLITEEIPLSTNEAYKVKRCLGQQQRPYNAGNNIDDGNNSSGGRHERQGPASESQRRLIACMRQNTTQQNKMERYIRDNGIDMDNLTNAQANEIIHAGKN